MSCKRVLSSDRIAAAIGSYSLPSAVQAATTKRWRSSHARLHGRDIAFSAVSNNSCHFLLSASRFMCCRSSVGGASRRRASESSDECSQFTPTQTSHQQVWRRAVRLSFAKQCGGVRYGCDCLPALWRLGIGQRDDDRWGATYYRRYRSTGHVRLSSLSSRCFFHWVRFGLSLLFQQAHELCDGPPPGRF